MGKKMNVKTDRTTKFLLVVIAMLLAGMLVRPMFVPLPAQAQSVSLSSTGSPTGQMFIDKDVLYVLRSGTITAYTLERGNGRVEMIEAGKKLISTTPER